MTQNATDQPDLPPQKTRPSSNSAALSSIDPRDAPALSLLGHDLRAALSEVIGGLRLIEPEHLPASVKAQVARTRAASEALALLLEQALSLLLNDGESPYAYPSVLQADRLIASVRLRWTERMRSHGLCFEISAGPDLPRHIAVEAALLERILSNLLGNAIKYAGAGKVICDLAAPTDRLLQITVSDQGPGFPPEIQKALFTNYSLARNTSKPGSGMGMMIVHDMVVRAGGTIVARNRPTGGAEIIVRLPLPEIGIDDIETVDPVVTPDLKAPRVLVADDSATNRLLLCRLLTNMGAEVVTVADGVQAIGRIEREDFDLAVIDIEMPEMNGLDVIRNVRAMSGRTGNLPILAVTAYQLRANKTAIETAGADGILSKPVASAASLRAHVVAVMASRASVQIVDPIAHSEVVVPLQFARLLQMAGPQIATEMLAGIQSDLRLIERGLLAASHGPNWQQVARQTHNLIAIAGTAGAEKLQNLATQMNTLANDPAPDRSTFLTLLPQVLDGLDGLIQFIGDYENSRA